MDFDKFDKMNFDKFDEKAFRKFLGMVDQDKCRHPENKRMHILPRDGQPYEICTKCDKTWLLNRRDYSKYMKEALQGKPNRQIKRLKEKK